MEKKKKDFRKYSIGFLAAFVSAVLMLTMVNALAAVIVNVGIADLEVTAGDYVTPSDVSSTGFTATVTGYNNNCGGQMTRTGSVTFKNTSDTDYVLSFNYTKTGYLAYINGDSLSGSVSKEITIGANQTLSMDITSPSGNNNSTVVRISNLKYTPVSTPATAAYAQVGDYPAQLEGDSPASVWSVTVTPGSDTIESLDVKVNGKGSNEGAWNGMNITGGTVVFGVAVNLAADAVNSVTAVVNGSDVTTTLE